MRPGSSLGQVNCCQLGLQLVSSMQAGETRGFFMTLADQASDGERLVGFVAVFAVICYGVARYLKTWSRRPLAPNPWDGEINADVMEDNGIPICHRCLAPHDPLANFCRDCGAPVGEYTNWLPYPYLFAVGHTLRIGTSDTFHRSPLTIAGFILLSVAEYTVFAPFYWLRLFLNIRDAHPSRPPANEFPGSKS